MAAKKTSKSKIEKKKKEEKRSLKKIMSEYITKEGLEKLKSELEYLEKDGRKEAAEKLKQAVSFGDLSENAAYDAAREAHSLLESRIAELKGIIANAKIIDHAGGKKSGDQKVQMGSTVSVKSDGQEEEFCIVGPEEADVLKGKISYESPLGKLLLGKKVGEKAVIKAPDGVVEYKILSIN